MDYLGEVWDETFPNTEKMMAKKRAKRKELAKIQREEQERIEAMTPEELEEFENSIPDWKKNALVTQENEPQSNEKQRFRDKMKEKVSQTQAAQNFYKSEEYEKLAEARKNYQDFKVNLKEGVENS